MAAVLPTKLQIAGPPSGQQIRERQNRHISWQGDAGSQGKVTYMNPEWKDTADIPTVDRVYMLLSWCENQGLFKIPQAYTVTYFNGGAYSFLFKISTAEPWVEVKSGKKVPKDVLVRISCAWAPYYGTESEVATMAYVASKGVVVPEVYFFDSSGANPFGYEFTVIQLMQGVESLANSPHQGDEYMEDRVMVQFRKLWNLEFDKSGSLYCDWGDGEFFVGPMVHHWFFCPSTRGFETTGDAIGPFATWEHYAHALLDARESLDHKAIKTISSSRPLKMDAAGTGPDLRAEIDWVSKMIDDHDEPGLTFKPRLVHHDMHMGNILVWEDSTPIAAIIDWEGAIIQPAGLIENIMPKALQWAVTSSGHIRAEQPHTFLAEYYAKKPREARKVLEQLVKI